MTAPVVLVAIDPGYSRRGQGCAVALFAARELVSVRFLRPETATADALCVCASAVVWECPQLDARSRADARSVVQLAAVGGTLAGMFAGACGCRAQAVEPSTWKGSVAKPVHHGRMWALLSPAERVILGGSETLARIEAAKTAGALDRWSKAGGAYYASTWHTHNLLDAAALGMWKLGRIAP